MSTALSHNLPEPLLSVRTRPLFVLREAVPPLIVVGQTPNAFRRIGVIQGGSFKGDRLSGEVVTGNDWQAVRTDSCIKLDVRLVLKTIDGWINRIIAIGIGHRLADGPVYNIFEVL